jgi:hypothetical protein
MKMQEIEDKKSRVDLLIVKSFFLRLTFSLFSEFVDKKK